MKNVLFYTSKTGFTKQYVDMLKNRIVPLEVYPIKKISKKLLEDADNIFYGGPIKNNVILGLSKFLKKYKYMKDKNIYVFATGIQVEDAEKRENVIMMNNLEDYHVRLYLLLGGMDISKMGFFQKTMMKIGLKIAANQDKANKEMILNRFSHPMNFVSNFNLDKMVETYRRVNLKK